LEEGALLGGGFVQSHGQVGPHRGQDQAGKTGAGAKIGQGFGRCGDQGHQLGGIPEVPMPKIGKRALCHEIMPGIPVG